MTPTAISDKMRTLKNQIAKVIEAADEGNLLRSQKLLQEVQRTNVALLRLLEMQVSGVSGTPRVAVRRQSVANNENRDVPVMQITKTSR
ncbi:MAG: hypothetical protein HC868_00390 [Sphingomonadales bacterium]|nr:hypothetical protein [Sphingomonadales bacterium]